MHTFSLADHPGPLTLPDRPTTDDFAPLPHGLTLDNAVAVRAHQVRPDDLLVAEFTDGTGMRPTEHIPDPYPADPHPLSACPCEGCETCDEVTTWTLGDHSRTADTPWRFVCLAPSQDDEPCTIVLRNRPIAIIPADVVTRAQTEQPPAAPVPGAPDKQPHTVHTVPAAEFAQALHAWNSGHPHAIPPETSDTIPVLVTVAGTPVEVHPGLLRMLTALITDQQAASAHPEGPCPHCAGTGQAAHATGPDPADFDSYEGSDGHIYHGFGEPDTEATAEAAAQAHDHDDDR